MKFAAASLFCVGVPLLPMFWRIVRADYSDRYATYQTGGFLAELNNQRIYLGWLVFGIMLIGILYGLYKKRTRSLAVLSAVGAVLTVLLVTRVQNMDDHQSLAVAPFYLLGCFLCALLVSELPWVRTITNMRYKVNVIATEYALNLKVPAYHMGTIIDEICARKGWERPWFVSESSERHCVSNAVASTSK